MAIQKTDEAARQVVDRKRRLEAKALRSRRSEPSRRTNGGNGRSELQSVSRKRRAYKVFA